MSRALLMASFLWASSLGGEAVDSRFLNLRGQGALTVYQQASRALQEQALNAL